METKIKRTIAILLVVFFVITFTISTVSASKVNFSKSKDSQKNITATMGADGHLQVICIANDGLPYLIWQDQKGGWFYYGQLPTDPNNKKSFKSVTAAMGADGHLQVICIANDGLPYLIWQDQKGGWFYYGQLPTDPNNKKSFNSITAAMGADGHLQVIGIANDGLPYLIWQDQKGGWFYYGQLPYVPIKMIFKYGVGAKNELDTFKGTYTKDRVTCSPITVSLTLTPEELNTIYQKMIEISFFNYPDKFVTPVGDIGTSQTPYSSYYFKVEHDGKIKELSWDDGSGTPSVGIPGRDNVIKLRGLIILIENIISTKDAYKSLPKPCGGYL